MPSSLDLPDRAEAGRPKMEDIARLANVSVATVSRALAGSPRVTAETRRRIEALVAQTGYVVNHAAAGLRLQRSRQVLVLLPTIANPFFSDVVLGIEDAAQQAGFSVLIASTGGLREREDVLARPLLTGAVDGLILLTGRKPGVVDSQELDRRIVALSERIAGLAVVTTDNVAASHAAAAHLIVLGHRRIGHIGGPAGNILSADRQRGYRAALAAAGIAFDGRLVAAGDFTFAAGAEAMRRLLAATPAPTAVTCANDELAIGAIGAARAAGLRVPRDLSVVGFDDIQFAAAFDPPLTTIRQSRREMGARAMALLADVLEGRPPARRRVLLPYALVLRGSTAAPLRPDQV
jgi:LacI family repressor for deo operon, udp, cdd, tsx, nupC, and nupG